MTYIFLLIGSVYGLIAALMAFVITWHELEKHKFERKRLIRESLKAAAVTFLFFIILSFFAELLISKYILE